MGPGAESKSKKKFTGLWIPITILVLQELTLNDKAVFSTLHYLSRNKPAFPSNEFIANTLKVSKRTVERSISKLLSQNLITNEGFDGRKRYLSVKNEVIMSKYHENHEVTNQKKLPGNTYFSDPASPISGHQHRQNDSHILNNDNRDNNNDVFFQLKNEINIFFKTNKLNNPFLEKQLWQFLNWLSLKKEIQSFQSKFTSYKEYKEASKERKHSLINFIGSPENEYQDGGWCTEDWGVKNKQFKINNHGKNNKRNSSNSSRFKAGKIEHKEDAF